MNALRCDLAGVNGDLAEVALRFVLSDPAVSTALPGMRTMRNVERNTAVPGPLNAAALEILKRHVWYKNFYS